MVGRLAERGFVVVRYDGRGVGQSGGRLENATLDDYAQDVVHVVNWLRRRRDVDAERIAVVGYGENAAVALLAARREDRIRGVALLAAPAVGGRALALEQQEALLTRMNVTPAERAEKIALQTQVLDATISEALKAAALAGIDVQVMISERGVGQLVPYWAGNTYAAEVAAAGVKVHLYRRGYLHAKTISIDGEICSIGSANMDIRSFSINYETNLVVYDEAVTRELEDDFLNDVAQCEVFTVATYARRGRGARFIDSTLRLCAPLL